ncbi:hypothetical protein GBAR_LOCUS12105 [Geodia barretti]|uniref:Uncharacterized protein n=1 Tax=Geodia barretti TaxID=519541 RepID=A0AA35RYS0_GEOBA|nr:hypothetical protein GBAR_LOCUS12105 [Geodia barretti]
MKVYIAMVEDSNIIRKGKARKCLTVSLQTTEKNN